MPGPDDLLSPDGGVSMDDFARDLGPSTTADEFDLPPPPPSPRMQRAQAATQAVPEVQVVVNKGAAAKAPPKAPDPLAWMQGATDGVLRITRLPDKGVDSHGKARRGRNKGRYVGIGDCGMVAVMPPTELRQYIIDNWGGGKYQIDHIVDGTKKSGDKPPISFPEDPLPIEGVGDDPDDDEDEDVSFEFQTPAQPAPQPQFQTHDPYGNPLDPYGRPYQMPQTPPRPGWQPTWLQENLHGEVSQAKEELEREREERRAAEARAAEVKAQAERERDRAEAARKEDLLRAELAALRESLNRPKDEGMSTMLQMMQQQAAAAQQRFEQESKEARLREEREARERREREDRERQDRKDREERAEKERRERDDRLEKERREDRRLQQEAQAAADKRNQEFMNMILTLNKESKKDLPPPPDPMKTIAASLDLVDRIRGDGDEEKSPEGESALVAGIKAAGPVLRPLADAFARGMAGPPVYVQQRVPGQVQQVQPQMQPQQIPQQPRAPQGPPQPAQSGGMPPQIAQVAKIVGVAAKGFKEDRDPLGVAGVMTGMAEAYGLTAHIESIANSKLTEIHEQLSAVLNMGLPNEQASQIQAFLDVYNAPGGRAWLSDLLTELGGGEDEEPEGGAPAEPQQ